MKLPSKYEDVVALAPGKNALVFRARNRLLDREVFVKAYPMPAASSMSALREPQLLQQLQHQNLVRIYGADVRNSDEGRFIFLEMELVVGGSFDALIEECANQLSWLPTHDVIRLVENVAAGLGYLHSKNFVHRDIKPANLLIRKIGSAHRGVVTDLGLAGRLDETGRAFASRHARLYRPPEVWSGKGYSVRSDVYQLGIVLFQLLGGKVRYKLGELDDDEVASAITAGKFMDWESLPPHVCRPLRSVIQQATAVREVDRFDKMVDLLVALNNVTQKQLNWKYHQSNANTGLVLERQEAGTTWLLMATRVDKDVFEFQRFKGKEPNKPRRVGPPVRIGHSNLGRSIDFQRLASEIW